MKLDYLIENPPPNARPEDLRRHFGQLYYLQGLSRSAVGDEIEDRTCQEKAIKIDPNFVGPYIRLGYLHESAGEIDEAVTCYKKAVDLEPNLAVTNTTLGGVYLMTGAFDEAIKYLERARKLSPLLLTTLVLGEAYAYTGRFTQALGWHESALSTITTPGMERERYVTYGGIWLYSFMPLHKGDMDTIKGYVTIHTFEQKKLLTLYLLGLDQGLLGNILRANERFAEAHAIKDTDDFAPFLLNRIGSILNFVDLEPDVRSWFEGKRQELSVTGKPPVTLNPETTATA
jgi:tetratricopeptide (TPR) repeat protein